MVTKLLIKNNVFLIKPNLKKNICCPNIQKNANFGENADP